MRRAVGKVLVSIALALGACSCAWSVQTPSVSTPAGNAPSTSFATREGLVAGLRSAALPITGKEDDYNALMAQVAGARVVLLGEATHGTAEFYRERMRITQRLIREKGFNAVVIEGDWPDAYRVNQYVRGLGRDKNGIVSFKWTVS